MWEGVEVATVTYESSLSVLSFMFTDALDRLARSIEEFAVDEDVRLLAWLKTQTRDGEADLHIDEEQGRAEFISRLSYVIRDLLLDGKGTVWCKECGQEIMPGNLTHRKRTPFDFGRGISKKDLKQLKKDLGLKGKVRIPGSGRTTFYCNQGHELFGTMDWVS